MRSFSSPHDPSKTSKTDRTYDWEREAVAQLYREYRSTLSEHRVSLRPVAIQLFDSETYWGKWDPTTRTLSIARNLVLHHSWFYVQAILRHEMAHQMVDDLYFTEAQGQGPHGEVFRKACAQLGVLREFSKPTAQLQEEPLDWRLHPQEQTAEKLLSKVQKLLALATSCNEHEALLAMNKVREIYAKYHLEQSQAPLKAGYSHLVICHKKKRIETHQDRMISILVEHFFVEVLTSSLFDAASGHYHRTIEIIGTRENALMAEYVYHFLLHQSDYWVRETAKRSKTKLSAIERKSLRLGLLHGFSEKLTQSERATQDPAALRPSGNRPPGSTDLSVVGQAIVQFKQDKDLKHYLARIYPRIKRTTAASTLLNRSAFETGQSIGRSITLNKAVTTGGKNQGRLLT